MSHLAAALLRRTAVPIALLAFGALAACDSPLIRDDYMGKSILQPGEIIEPVERNADGNPILE